MERKKQNDCKQKLEEHIPLTTGEQFQQTDPSRALYMPWATAEM